MALVTAAEVRARMAPAETADRDAEIVLCIAAAQSYLVPPPGRIEEPSTAATVMLSGDDACGPYNSVLYFPPGMRRMVKHSGSDLVTVKEDGLDLTVPATVSYSTTAGALLEGVNEDSPAKLLRGNSSSKQCWRSGRHNVEVKYKSGWSAANLPASVKHLLIRVAWHMFTGGAVHGMASASDPGGSVTIERGLPQIERDILDHLRRNW